MRDLAGVSVLLAVLIVSSGSTQAKVENSDEQAFEWCLSHFLEPDELPIPLERPIKTLPPFSMEGVITPPDLVKETVIVGNLPDAIKAYGGLWISPVTGKSMLPYAAYVEHLTPTEMTIALLLRPPDDLKHQPATGLRQKLVWDGTAFESKTTDLMGIKGGVTFRVVISTSGDALGFGWANDREAYLLGCLISSKHY